jgi:hypothetical protein
MDLMSMWMVKESLHPPMGEGELAPLGTDLLLVCSIRLIHQQKREKFKSVAMGPGQLKH